MKKIIALLWLGITCWGCSKDDSLNNNTAAVGGSTARMAIAGNYLYSVTTRELQTYDISVPSQAVLLSSQTIGWNNIETIFPYRDKLFIGAAEGMYVFDNSNPKNPSLQGRADHLRACDPVVADDDYAYVTLRSNNNGCGGTLNQLNIYDIRGAQVLSPVLVSSLVMSEPHGLGYKGNVLYICLGKSGMNVVDITDKTQPRVINQFTEDDEDYIDVIPYDDVLITFVANGVILFDISDPAHPTKLSEIKN